MHRTEGPDYIDEGVGLRRYKVSPPPATVANHEAFNALQEELVNVVEYAGITLNTTAVADRTEGWIQVRDAIFDSEAIDTGAIATGAITTTKISDCDLSKLSYDHALGGTDITYEDGALTYTLELSPTIQYLRYESGAAERFFRASYSSIQLSEYLSGALGKQFKVDTSTLSIADWTTYPTEGITADMSSTDGLSHTWIDSGSTRNQGTISYNGLHFNDSGYSAGDPIRFRTFDFDGVTWSGAGPYTGTLSPIFSNTRKPLMAQFSWRVVSGGTVHVANSSTDSTTYDYTFTINGSHWAIAVTLPVDISGASYDQRRLTVWYA